MLYLFFFAPGMGPMPWTINSEIYPLWARSFCYSTSTSVNWFFNLLVSLTFLSLTEVLTKYGAFYLYAGISLIGWVIFYLILPETKGKTCAEIEDCFKKGLLNKDRKKYDDYHRVEDSDSDASSRPPPNTTDSSSTTSSTAGPVGARN